MFVNEFLMGILPGGWIIFILLRAKHMQMNNIEIINGRILIPHGIIENGSLQVSDGLISGVSERAPGSKTSQIIDAAGNFVVPGFIDMHIHGGGGHDFMDGTVAAFLGIAETHARYGTTALTPTTLAAGKEDLLHTLDIYKQAVLRNESGAQFLGMHLEGPYFAMNQRGAQDPRYIRNPDEREYREIVEYANGNIARWSAAPELEGAMAFGRYMKAHGILPAIAHTDGVYEDVVNALENGYTLATHFYSAMSGVTRINGFRHTGVIESVYLLDGIDVEIIADGVHLPAPLLKLICKVKGLDHVALITDAMRAAGMPPGESILGSLKDGLRVIVEDDVAKLPDRSSFAGSVATADRLVRTMIRLAGIGLPEAVRMMTVIPARIMGISHRKGSLTPGMDADIVIFDEDIRIQKTISMGRVIYSR
jgi:N-acetylglucosamine-6-phosphate deacetylase